MFKQILGLKIFYMIPLWFQEIIYDPFHDYQEFIQNIYDLVWLLGIIYDLVWVLWILYDEQPGNLAITLHEKFDNGMLKFWLEACVILELVLVFAFLNIGKNKWSKIICYIFNGQMLNIRMHAQLIKRIIFRQSTQRCHKMRVLISRKNSSLSNLQTV